MASEPADDGLPVYSVADYLMAFHPVDEALPLFHTVSSASALAAVGDGLIRLNPNTDPLFARRIAFAFYGRPAYRRAAGEIHRLQEFSFGLKHDEAVGHASGAFPFDTGAWRTGRYKDHNPEGFDLDNYNLPRQYLQERVHARYVSHFFGTNKSYYQQIAAPNDAPSASHPILLCYRLVRHHGPHFYRRSATIEFHFLNDLDNLARQLMFVLLPDKFYETDALSDYCSRTGIDAIHYHEDARNQLESANEMLTVAEEYLIAKDLLK